MDYKKYLLSIKPIIAKDMDDATYEKIVELAQKRELVKLGLKDSNKDLSNRHSENSEKNDISILNSNSSKNGINSTSGINIEYDGKIIEDVATKTGEIYDGLNGTSYGKELGKIVDEYTKNVTIKWPNSKTENKDFISAGTSTSFFDFFDFKKLL